MKYIKIKDGRVLKVVDYVCLACYPSKYRCLVEAEDGTKKVMAFSQDKIVRWARTKEELQWNS